MKKQITVREYARLTTEPLATSTLDRAHVSPSAFDWLCQLSGRFSASGAALVELENRRWLKLDNYVGVIETPCGTRLEILPKTIDDGSEAERSRALLRRMISTAIDLPVRLADEAAVQRFSTPLSEWVIQRFLKALEHLIKRGVRSDYFRTEGSEYFLRGQLDTVRQMRQAPGRQHVFCIRHDLFLPDRPENRLLKLALDRAFSATQSPDNWRLANELCAWLHEIPPSWDVAADFRAWRSDRLMAHYQPLRPWCELILFRQMPHSLVGTWHGISVLFPMEKLFERYVAGVLRRKLAPEAKLQLQAASMYLCEHNDSRMFRLEPDLLVACGDKRWILDTKWKRLDGADVTGKYGLSQADFYQLFAYGHKYLAGCGEMMLIFPRRTGFSAPLPKFNFSEDLSLTVLPFDLDNDDLIGGETTNLPLRPTPSVAPRTAA